jgi:hypothetical protein
MKIVVFVWMGLALALTLRALLSKSDDKIRNEYNALILAYGYLKIGFALGLTGAAAILVPMFFPEPILNWLWQMAGALLLLICYDYLLFAALTLKHGMELPKEGKE